MENLNKIGLIPPQAIDLERAVLGAFLIDSKSLNDTLLDLNQKVFYEPKHQIIFNAIKSAYVEKNRVDLLIVIQELKRENKMKDAGGDRYLIDLTQSIASTANTEFHVAILLQKYFQREIIEISSNMTKQAYRDDSDVFDLVEDAYRNLNLLTETHIKSEEKKLGEVVIDVVKKGVDLADGKVSPGIITPIQKITKTIGGWADAELIILAGRPGMGKTAFSLGCALTPAKIGIPTAFFSLEMSKEQLTTRLMSMEYKIPSDKFRKKGLQASDLSRIDGTLDKIPLIIDDTPNISIEHFQIKANQMKSKYGIKLIIVDYIQLMSSKGKGSRENEVSKISRGLKLIAKELKIPVIALSQLSRAVETRGGSKRPQLSDLRESGAIEQDADIVSFIYRPEYYGMTEWDDEEHLSCLNQAEFIIAKNRNGSLMRTRMAFEGEFTLFSDLESITYENKERIQPVKEEPNKIPQATLSEAFGGKVPF